MPAFRSNVRFQRSQIDASFMNHDRDADNNGRTTTALFELAAVTPVSPPIMAEPDGVVRENAESFRQIIRGRQLGFLSLNKFVMYQNRGPHCLNQALQ